MTGATETTDLLTQAAMSGDREAFGRLVGLCQASVRALTRRLARSASDGDDIAQAAFMIAWRRRSTWRGGSFRSWVCAIAYREFLHTRRGRVEIASDEDIGETVDDDSGARMDLSRAMGALDVNERAAIALCLGAGLSHGEAALAMGAPLGSVKSWVLRGRGKLQKSLAAYERA